MSSARCGHADQHRKIVIVAQHLRQLPRGRDPDCEFLWPGAREQAHLPPMPLHRLAQCMETFVRRLAIGIFHRLACLAVALLETAIERGKAAPAKSHTREFLSFPEKQQTGLCRAIDVERLRSLSDLADEMGAQRRER